MPQQEPHRSDRTGKEEGNDDVPLDSSRGTSAHVELLDGERDLEDVRLVNDGQSRSSPHGCVKRVQAAIHEDPLLVLTLVGVAVGVMLGLLLSAVLPGSDDPTGMRKTIVKLISFPGKMFLNLLKMMVLPLISGSMIAGVCALQSAGTNTGKLARVTLSYFAGTTLIAVILGLLVVNVVQPG